MNRQVLALYQQLLGRDPDRNGYSFWTAQSSTSLGLMCDLFLGSREALDSDFQVLAIYQAVLNRHPSFDEYAAALAGIRSGSQAPSQLYNDLLNSAEYRVHFAPPGLLPATVTGLYQHLLGRSPGSSEITSALTALSNGTTTLYGLFYGMVAGAEFRNTDSFRTAADHSNALYVKMVYFLVLKRDPDAGGYGFWVGVANGGGAGIYFNSQTARISILGNGSPGEGFVGSPEFQSRFQ